LAGTTGQILVRGQKKLEWVYAEKEKKEVVRKGLQLNLRARRTVDIGTHKCGEAGRKRGASN